MDLNMNSNHYSALAETLSSVEEVLSSVKNVLESEPVTDEVRQSLLERLDLASQNLSSLERTAANINQFAQSYFQQLRQKAISLYGKVDDSYLQHEVIVLQDETHGLEDTMNKKDLSSMAERIEEIKEHLIKILNEFRPALQERRALVAAKLVLEKAEAFLRGEKLPEFPLDELSFLETEEILEELAEYLSDNNRGALRLLMRRLTPAQKKIVLAYLEPKDLLSSLLHDVEGSTDQNIMIAG
jgi:hypothetical protein